MLDTPLMPNEHLNQLDKIDAIKFGISKTNIVDTNKGDLLKFYEREKQIIKQLRNYNERRTFHLK